MNPELKARKELLSPPGDTIQETIDEIGMSQAELATRMGRPKEKLNDVIKGREPISIKTAIQLERVLGIPASFWLAREREYREELARIEQEECLEKDVVWLDNFPIRELKKLGYLPDEKDKFKQIGAVLNFFSVGSVSQWNEIYLSEKVSAVFRISLTNTNSPHSVASWLRIGEIEIMRRNLPEYNEKAFRNALKILKKTIATHPDEFKEILQKICFDCGVGIVYTPCLHNAPISGATRWIYGKPLIQLSDRYKTNNHFWFSFYHEAGHILLHGKKDIFLEDLHGSIVEEEKEKEANGFSQEFLFPYEKMKDLIREGISDESIKSYARELNVHPGIIVGQLQHYGFIKYSQRNSHKVRISL